MRQHEEDGVTYLKPAKFLAANIDDRDEKKHVALVILNSSIRDYELFRRLYDHSGYTICADGGANRLHDLLRGQYIDVSVIDALKMAPPNAIHGDLDSLEAEVRQLYTQIGVEVSHDSDQYSTDFAKAIKKILQHSPTVQDVLVLGSLGGRVDQGISLLHQIYREQNFQHPDLRLWLFTDASVSVLLQPGRTVVCTPLADGLITRNVGILPLYGKATLTLEGFEWDVENWPSEMGGQLSTSNHIVAEELSITTDTTVLFTVERKSGRQ